MGERGGRASQAMTRLVLETYGRECHLRLPKCKGVATTKDHIVPYSHGGQDVLENYRPACKPCNSRRQNRVRTGYGASVVIVCGPPAAGKSHYIAEHAKPGDVTIDLDRIARAVMATEPETTHTYPQHVRHVAIAARKAAIHTATRLRERVTVWLIHALPSPEDIAEYQAMTWQIVTIDPGRAVVEARAREQRPEAMMHHVNRWYSEHPESIELIQVREPPATPLALESSPDW